VRPALLLGRAADPKAQVLDAPFRCGPIALGPLRGRSAPVVRGLGRPSRAARVCPGLAFVSSDSTGGTSAPCQVGALPLPWWPAPSDDRLAFASSHILDPLGLGPLDRQLSQLPDPPWGFPCSVSRKCRRRRVPRCPGGGLSGRWADARPAHPLHRPFWSEPVSRFGSFDVTRCAGVHPVTHRVCPLARSPGAAPRGQYVAACFPRRRDQRRMTPRRRGGQDRLGHHDQSCLTPCTSHLEAVGCSAWLAEAPLCRSIANWTLF
jgi:hypothetical protein